MERKTNEILLKYINESDPVVIAVSGGVDSVALLFLAAKKFKNGVVVHLNHGLRRESTSEELFVSELAKKFGLTYYVKNLKLTKRDEATARKERYRFLRQIKEKVGAKYILTAHHANDQAETVLMKMLRGSGPLELWGMKECEGDILRPFLKLSKDEIEDFARKNRLKWVTDRSNNDTRYLRNDIRARVMPELIRLNPQFLQVLATETQLGEELAEASNYYVNKSIKKVKKENMILLKPFLKLPIFIQKEVVREMLREMTGTTGDIYSKNISEVLKLAYAKENKETSLKGFTIKGVYDKIIFDLRPTKASKKAKIELGKKVVFNGFVFQAKVGRGVAKKNNILLNPSVKYNLNIRTWRAGDKIITSSGTKKLQDVFTDGKVPPVDRRVWPIVVEGKKIIWVPGLVASKEAKSASNNALIIEVKNERTKI